MPIGQLGLGLGIGRVKVNVMPIRCRFADALINVVHMDSCPPVSLGAGHNTEEGSRPALVRPLREFTRFI